MTLRYLQNQKAHNLPGGAFWIFLILTWVLSFLTQHDIFFSVSETNATFEQLSDGVVQGNDVRRVALPLLAVVGFVSLVRYGRGRLRIRGILGWAILAFFLWMFASISWSVDPGLSVRRLVAFAFMIIAAMGTATIAFERLPIFITTFCSLNLAAGVLSEIVLGTFSIGTAGYRFGGTVHPNLQGVNLALLIIGCVWLVWQKMNKRNWATYGCLTAATIFLVLTGSRTTLGAVVLTFLFTLGIQGVRRRGFKSLGFAVPVATLLASVVLTLAISTPWISLRALTKDTIMMERDEGDLSLLTGRVAVWQTVLEYIGDRPILGYGHDAFWSADRIEEISRIRGWPVSHAHNGYIEMLANLGAVGLGLYMVVILLGTIQCSRQFLRGDDACGIASALMVFGLFHNLLESIMVLPLFSQFFILTALLNAGFLNRSVRIA